MDVAELVKVRCLACGLELALRPAAVRIGNVPIRAVDILHEAPVCARWRDGATRNDCVDRELFDALPRSR